MKYKICIICNMPKILNTFFTKNEIHEYKFVCYICLDKSKTYTGVILNTSVSFASLIR